MIAVAIAVLVAGCSSSVEPSPSASNASASPASAVPSVSPPQSPAVIPSPTTGPAPSLVPPPPPPAASSDAGSTGPCGPNGVFCGPFGWTAAFGVPFTDEIDCGTAGRCQLKADVYSPVPTAAAAKPSTGWSLVVAIPGGPAAPGARSGLSALATALAVQGAVVFVADWREGPAWGGGYPASFQDVACAVRFARSTGADYGADPARVTLAAHSFGGFAGAVVSLSPKPIGPQAAHCLGQAGSPRPDAYVGLAPVSSFESIGSDFLAAFLGGSRDDASAATAWAASDPVRLAAEASGAPPIRLIVGGADVTVPAGSVGPFYTALQASGSDATLLTIPAADHQGVLVRPEAIATIIGLARP